jgi:hypothetical protein
MTDLENDRIFYANVGFFYSAAGGGATTYLNGVQSVDYTRDLTPETIFDPGHMQQVYMRYGKRDILLLSIEFFLSVATPSFKVREQPTSQGTCWTQVILMWVAQITQ